MSCPAQRAEISSVDFHAAPPRWELTRAATVLLFIRTETAAFLAAPWAADIPDGNLPDARRVPALVDALTRRLRQLASIG